MSTEPEGQPGGIGKYDGLKERLEQASARLNEASNMLQAEIQKLDAMLASLNLGVESFIDLRPGDGEINRQLGYGRIRKDWGLMLRVLYSPTPDQKARRVQSAQFWFYNNAPRHMRIAAVDRLADLFEQLLADTGHMLGDMRRATALAMVYVEAIEKAMGIHDGDSRRRDGAPASTPAVAGGGSETQPAEETQAASPPAAPGDEPRGDGVRGVPGHRYTPLRSRLVRRPTRTE